MPLFGRSGAPCCAMDDFLHTAIQQDRTLAPMASETRIINVEKDDPDGIVTFSDGTVGAYVVEELLDLRPYREQVQVGSIPSAKEKCIAEVPRSLDQVLHSHGIPRHRGK
jgi:hypothetical protein